MKAKKKENILSWQPQPEGEIASNKKTKIYLKRPGKKQIPKVKIQLDGLLSSAYSQMKQEPGRNNFISEQYNLSNDLIRQYIYEIYSQYSIADPCPSQTPFQKNHNSANRNNSQEHFQTPKRISATSENLQNARTVQNRKNRSNTMEKIQKIKKNFQKQFASREKQITETIHDHQTDSHFCEISDGDERMFPIPRASKKTKIRLSKGNKSAKEPKVSHILNKNFCHYCIMCEEPLEGNLISQHQKECQQFQQFLTKKALTQNDIIEHLKRKIKDLQADVSAELHYIKQDITKIGVKFQNVLNRRNLVEGGECLVGDRLEVKQFISSLKTVSCWQNLDKLQWFQLMLDRAIRGSLQKNGKK